MGTDLNERLKRFALRIIHLYSALPKRGPAVVLGNQVIRSGTSPGAQYREARRAKSDADFISKIEGALQELDETAYWLELIQESGLDTSVAAGNLQSETNQLLAIFASITKKAKVRKLSG